MPPSDSSALIVARFLKANHYTESYDAFINEAGLPDNAGDVSKGDLTLEALLEEKKTFDLSVKFEKLGTGDGSTRWSEGAPEEERAVTTLPSRSNLLSVNIDRLTQAGHNDSEDSLKSFLLATTADRRLHMLDVPTCTLQDSFSSLHDSPLLSSAVLKDNIILTTSMSGQLTASTLSGKVLDTRKDHSKYVVKVAIFQNSPADESYIIATAGWDNKIHIYYPTLTPFSFHDPTSTITLPTKPESFLFLPHPSTSEPIILVSRTDSTHLFFYSTSSPPNLLGTQNLAPHSNAWVAFTPSSLALCPTDLTLLAVATNSVPHMKLLIVRLLITASLPNEANDAPLTQNAQARTALAIADREAEAILIHANTLAPQTPYSTPCVVWRPDGCGVWVNGDDGIVRGLEASTGKVVAKLKGHEEGSKVRCLWAGIVAGEEAEEGEEWLVSGGFDQKLIVWKCSFGGGGG